MKDQIYGCPSEVGLKDTDNCDGLPRTCIQCLQCWEKTEEK